MNQKVKNTLLISSFIIVCLFAYNFSFLKTKEKFQELKNLEHQESLNNTYLKKINYLKQQDIYYSKQLEELQISIESSFQNNLLTVISNFNQNEPIKIINFESPYRFKLNNGLQETYVFTIESNFKTILNLLYKFEQQYRVAKIISVNFIKTKDYKKNKTFLQCEIYLQRVILENN